MSEESLKDIDPETLTIGKLKSILTKNNVELPIEPQRKAFYVEKFHELQQKKDSALKTPTSPPNGLRRHRSRSRSPSPKIEMVEAPLPAEETTAGEEKPTKENEPKIIVSAPTETPAVSKRRRKTTAAAKIPPSTAKKRSKKVVAAVEEEEPKEEEKEEKKRTKRSREETPPALSTSTTTKTSTTTSETAPSEASSPKKRASEAKIKVVDNVNPFQSPEKRRLTVIATGTNANPIPIDENTPTTKMAEEEQEQKTKQKEIEPIQVPQPSIPSPSKQIQFSQIPSQPAITEPKIPTQPIQQPQKVPNTPINHMPTQEQIQQQPRKTTTPIPPPISPFTPQVNNNNNNNIPSSQQQQTTPQFLVTPSRAPILPGKPPKRTLIIRGIIVTLLIAFISMSYFLFIHEAITMFSTITPIKFCDSYQQEESLQCVPCPEHGFCSNGQLKCVVGYRRSGISKCIEDFDISEISADIANASHEILSRSNWRYHCFEITSSEMVESELKAKLLSDYSNIVSNSETLEAAFEVSRNRHFKENNIKERIGAEGSYYSTTDLNPIWFSSCSFKSLFSSLFNSLVTYLPLIIISIFVIISSTALMWYRKRMTQDKTIALGLMEQAREILIDRQRRFESGAIKDPYVSIEILHDMLIPPERQNKDSLRQWNRAFKLLGNDARILKGTLMSNGIQVDAFKWIAPV